MTQLINFGQSAAQYGIEALALLLIIRLLSMREQRERVYYVFSLFLAVQLVTSLGYLLLVRFELMDYRVFFMVVTSLLWGVSLWLVYSLAQAVLAGLPGILKFSKRLLNTVFPCAILLALFAERGQFRLSVQMSASRIYHLVLVFMSVDRAISMASVLVLVVILTFILWFPVRMSKNLAIFSIGLVVYFGLKTGLLILPTLVRPGFLSQDASQIVSLCVSVVLVFCFLYWIVFIDAKGQRQQVKIGHSWQPDEQAKLLTQLESMNWALQRSSRQV